LANVVRPHVEHEKKALAEALFDYYVFHIELFVGHIDQPVVVDDDSFASDVGVAEGDVDSSVGCGEALAADYVETFVVDVSKIAIAGVSSEDGKKGLFYELASSVAGNEAAEAVAETFAA